MFRRFLVGVGLVAIAIQSQVAGAQESILFVSEEPNTVQDAGVVVDASIPSLELNSWDSCIFEGFGPLLPGYLLQNEAAATSDVIYTNPESVLLPGTELYDITQIGSCFGTYYQYYIFTAKVVPLNPTTYTELKGRLHLKRQKSCEGSIKIPDSNNASVILTLDGAELVSASLNVTAVSEDCSLIDCVFVNFPKFSSENGVYFSGYYSSTKHHVSYRGWVYKLDAEDWSKDEFIGTFNFKTEAERQGRNPLSAAGLPARYTHRAR